MKYYRVFKVVNGKTVEQELSRDSINSEKIAEKEVELLQRYGYQAHYVEYPDALAYSLGKPA